MATAPNTGNYSVFKGEFEFTPLGGTKYHMGNVPQAELEMEVETLDHFSAMTGTKSKDFTAVTQKKATLNITCDEFTASNVQMHLLGTQDLDTDGNITVDIGTEDMVRGMVEFTGKNSVGRKISMVLPDVQFRPASAFPLISDEFAQMEFTGEVNAVNGSFGTVTFLDSQSE